jgi:Domain of unknown function (DUF955).
MTNVSLKDVLQYLLFIANKNDIRVVLSDELSSSTADFAITKLRTVVMNVNLDSGIELVFRLAHELSHLLFGDSDNVKLYQFSPYFQKSEERTAHNQAMHMIAKFVFQDTPIEYRNYLNFMDILGLPSWFEEMAKDAVLNA